MFTMTNLVTDITYFGQKCRAICDLKCEKAWGVASRPKITLSDDPDDYASLADGELGEAPADPGTYEGGHGKPHHPRSHNKWCVRECERSIVVKPGEAVSLPDFSQRRFNLRSRMET